MKLLIGNKTWSTWSLRPWLVLKRAGLPFEEVLIRLRQDDTPDQIRAAGSPSGKVPVLIDGDLAVWDSLSIAEYVADKTPQAKLWPEDVCARAEARSAAAEMHSGFSALRSQCPMDLNLSVPLELSEDTARDVRRIVELWTGLRARYAGQGPFLVGAWSIADAFFTPVATRFDTYQVDLAAHGDDGTAAAYVRTLLSTPEFVEWRDAALAE